MLKREIIRIIILGLLGLAIMCYIYIEDITKYKSVAYIFPFYVIGMFYAGRILVRLLDRLFSTYFSCQCLSLVTNPLWGTILSIIVLAVGVSVIFTFGWILGICRGVYALFVAYQMDKQILEGGVGY